MGCVASSTNARSAGREGMVRRDMGGGEPTNRRLRPGAPWAMPDPVSAGQIANKRSTFWETAPQAGGRRAVWDNLRMISETLLAGDGELATTLVSAAELRVPHGDLSVVFDSTGRMYELPRFVYSNPSNLMSDEEAVALAACQAAAPSRVSEHKGPVTAVSVTMRIGPGTVNGEQDVKLKLQSDTRVDAVKVALHEMLLSGGCDQKSSEEVKKPNRWAGKGLPVNRQRLMFRGRELRDGQHVQECGAAEDGAVLQVFVRPE